MNASASPEVLKHTCAITSEHFDLMGFNNLFR